MYKRIEKYLAYFMLLVMCISLFPVMYAGRYNHPTGDDYYYGVEVKAAVEEGAGFLEILQAAAKGTLQQYKQWQGTYSAMFLMHLPPNAFSEEAYAFVTAVLILLFAGGAFFLLKPIVCVWLRGTRQLWILVSSTYVLLCLQTTPYLGESIFWYNGSMYYTGFLALTMFFWGGVFRFLIQPRWYLFLGLALGAFFIAGGNYVSLLPCILLLTSLTVLLLLKRSRNWMEIGILTIVMLTGLLISAFAPGNQIRQADLYQISAGKAILKSLLQGVKYIMGWSNGWLFFTAVLLTPFWWHSFEGRKLSFRYPIMVLGFFYGVFCSMACPTFYSMNSTGPARVVAIIYDVFIAYMLFSYYYLLGWFYHWMKKRQKTAEMNREIRIGVIGRAAAGVCVLLFGLQLFMGKQEDCTVFRSIRILESGEALAYHEEYRERLEILCDDTVQEVVFTPYVNQPDMLYVGDFMGDAENGNNVRIAQYWGKKSLRVNYE